MEKSVKLPASELENKPCWTCAMTLGDMFDQTAESCYGDAVVFPHERITYPELAELSNRYAKALIGLGIQRYDKVGILIPSGVDFFALLFAIFKAGAIAVPVNGRFKERELRHVLTKSDMKVLFTSSDTREFTDYAALLLSAIPALADFAHDCGTTDVLGQVEHVICISGDAPHGFLTRDEFEGKAVPVSDADLLRRRMGVRIRDTAILMFTSGTTAYPKAAMLSHEALSRGGLAYAHSRLALTSSDRVWTAMPLYHIGGIGYGFGAFCVGAAYCHCGFFNPEVSLRQLADEKCTVALPSFETIWLSIINQPAFSEIDLSSLRLIFMVGVPEQLQRLQMRIPHAVQIGGFGSTESSAFLCMNLPTDPLEARMKTCGHPLPGMEVRIVDPDSGAELGPDQRGEIQYRGPKLFDGYYKEPELTRQAIDEHGWFHSGDLGELDKDGRLLFKGRLKDMLKVGGENVAAVEIEDFLIAHPAILIVQVVSAPDSRYDEVPTAFVQLKEGAACSEEEVINFCLGRIATFKVPRYVRFVTEWPMSGTKIQKFVLREWIADELRRAGITEAPKPRSIREQ